MCNAVTEVSHQLSSTVCVLFVAHIFTEIYIRWELGADAYRLAQYKVR
jgi:hypothetical protein